LYTAAVLVLINTLQILSEIPCNSQNKETSVYMCDDSPHPLEMADKAWGSQSEAEVSDGFN
jgi:hypothetical protein